MQSKGLVLVSLITAIVVPVVAADVPDGHGGRTSPSVLGKATAPSVPAHACCSDVAQRDYTMRVQNPAELKALGHGAWVDSGRGPAPRAACYKRVPLQQAKYNSPVELKTQGHLASRTETAPKVDGQTCCANGKCPMRGAKRAAAVN